MNHRRTWIALALSLAALTPLAQAHDQGSSKEDKCERITSKALCINTVASDKVKSFIEGLTVRKVIVVPGRLVNVVAN